MFRLKLLRTVIAGMPRRARVSILRDQIGSKIGRGKSCPALHDCDVSSERCGQFGLEKNDCEATLGLYVVPSVDVPEGLI